MGEDPGGNAVVLIDRILSSCVFWDKVAEMNRQWVGSEGLQIRRKTVSQMENCGQESRAMLRADWMWAVSFWWSLGRARKSHSTWIPCQNSADWPKNDPKRMGMVEVR